MFVSRVNLDILNEIDYDSEAFMSEGETDLTKRLKGIQWQTQNCLSCIWFHTTDPLNADLLDRALCIHPKLKPYQLVVTGRDWCNLWEEIKQKQIDHKQEMAMKAEAKPK